MVLNIKKREAFSVGNDVINWLEKKGIHYLIEADAAEILNNNFKADYQYLRDNTDIIIVIGGDGTFLHTAHHFFTTDIPLLGINIGHLGFLTEIETNELTEALNRLLLENYKVEKRMILEARLFRKGEEIYKKNALNDIVIHRGAKSRMVGIDLFINEEIVNSYRSDGLIVATPTGSTAYSLSAGGPIINPQIRAIIITPICPHTIFIRPMVISDKEKLKVVITAEHTMKLTADGRYDWALKSADQIHIQAAEKELSVIKLPERTFYTILHKKMRLGLV